ncbi:hypothetical protein [Streptomyces microflavus]|uniref:hypothetical protein n=1 Tax=Streptomyces microflavus TaxID=1919 RepID=UPI00386E811A|nr:hypothetical protein OG269_25915 [Streptomyces microflavus]
MTDINAPIQACTDPRHTGARRVALGCNGPDPAEAEQPAAAPDAPDAPAFARAFRLIQRNGTAIDGVEFTNGRVIVMDDPDWGLCSGARSLELLLRSGYHGARIERPDEQLPARVALLEQLLAEAVDLVPEGDLRDRLVHALNPPAAEASGE